MCLLRYLEGVVNETGRVTLDDFNHIPDLSDIEAERAMRRDDNGYDAEADYQEIISTATREPFKLTVRTAKEIDAEPDPPATQTLLGPFITRGERTIVVGDTGHGKTTLSLQMLGAVLLGNTLLDHEGAGEGPVMIVDLEQGRRAIKRGLREAGLHERDDVLHISVPDGLALDRDKEHVDELKRVIADSQPVLLLLDPYYKAHRADDSNQERPIVDLMRQLDALRTIFGFALLLPAHPRKDLVGREGTRKLTLHDIAGSGAVTRGAEIVLAIERLAHGFARLRYLKDREGDLPIGEHLSLLYDKTHGYRLDPREDESDEEIEQKILTTEAGWLTATEWQKKTSIRRARVSVALANLAASGRIAHMIGPAGRSPQAKCYGTRPECWEQSAAQTTVPAHGTDDSALFPNPGTTPDNPGTPPENTNYVANTTTDLSQTPGNTPEHPGTVVPAIESESVPEPLPSPLGEGVREQSNDPPAKTGTPEPIDDETQYLLDKYVHPDDEIPF